MLFVAMVVVVIADFLQSDSETEARSSLYNLDEPLEHQMEAEQSKNKRSIKLLGAGAIGFGLGAGLGALKG